MYVGSYQSVAGASMYKAGKYSAKNSCCSWISSKYVHWKETAEVLNNNNELNVRFAVWWRLQSRQVVSVKKWWLVSIWTNKKLNYKFECWVVSLIFHGHFLLYFRKLVVNLVNFWNTLAIIYVSLKTIPKNLKVLVFTLCSLNYWLIC